jgi:hypothetical protein
MAEPTPAAPAVQRGDWSVVLRSIGTGGAAIVAGLKQIAAVPEQVIAARLFQAPSLLFQDLPREVAERAATALRQAGLECDIQPRGQPFTPGDAEHEVALVVRDYARMGSLLGSVVQLLGVGAQEARNMLCSSPAVLLGRISLATVEALRRRFEPLGAELDVSRTPAARFDVFLGDCPPADQARARQMVARLGLPAPDAGRSQPLLAVDLSLRDAERLWDPLRRGNLPARVINRDFARFDLRLEAAPASPELTAFLVETAGMPERIVGKVLQRLPIVTHPNIRFAELCGSLDAIARLGGRASGQLLAFQRFALTIDKVGDADAANGLIRALAGLSKAEASAALATHRRIAGPLTHLQAHWLQFELKRAETSAQLVLL